MNERLGKSYKLCSKKLIDAVFNEGIQQKKYPFVLRYIPITLNESVPFQVGISVPKKRFKRAVDRNRIKRLIREAVRKNKYILMENFAQHHRQYAFFIIYTSNEKFDYHRIEATIQQLFITWMKSFQENKPL